MSHFPIVAIAASVLAVTVTAQSGVYSLADATTTLVYTVTQNTGGDVPLASKRFEYPYLPYHADSDDGPRGTQQGYNLCNSTTLGADSWCQTGFLNSIDDFCLWGSPDGVANQTVANEEEELVAFCTTATHGTRVIPPGALQGVQFIQTPDYVEVVGYIDQTALGFNSSDYGGEEDDHGADERGNPLGALMYSSAFGNGTASPYQQAKEWDYLYDGFYIGGIELKPKRSVGSGVFCFKVCNPNSANGASLCQHTYDRIGCTYNSPADYNNINGTFTSCKGDDQMPVGIYVSNGATHTYYQPPESLGQITTIPYTPSLPATSQCTTYSSNSLYTALASYWNSASPTTTTTTSTSGPTSLTTSAKAAHIAANAQATASTVSASTGSGSKVRTTGSIVSLMIMVVLALS